MELVSSRGIDLSYATAETPRAGHWWQEQDDGQRMMLVNSILATAPVICVSAKSGGVVTLQLSIDYSAADRGMLLRALEVRLKAELDPALEVYLQAQIDKNALRKLRGVQIVER